MNSRGVDALLNSKVKLGASLSAAAGPKGRSVGASTDASLRAEILSYSRSRGLFAGVNLNGSSIRSDDDANRRFYGKPLKTAEIIAKPMMEVPPEVKEWQATLAKYAK
jgi:lipid-binding SYLF domain-containing protein